MHVQPGKSMLHAAVALGAVALIAGGCGEDSGASTSADAGAPGTADFPAADGKTLMELAADIDQNDLVIAPTQRVYRPGENRFGFGVFEVDQTPVEDAQVAIYAAPPNKPAVGPFAATAESMEVASAFESQTSSTDPDAAHEVYKADVDLDGDGEWRLMAMIREPDGSMSYSLIPSAVVGGADKVPAVGEEAPSVSTPTADDVGGDLAKIDTRTPASTMHDVDLQDVIGKEPVVLLFATPALCSSRVCGPVVDIAEEAKAARGDDAAFIQMEIYEDNDPNKGIRPQVKAYGLPSEPWLFVLDSDGKVSTEIEGAFTPEELDAALDKVAG